MQEPIYSVSKLPKSIFQMVKEADHYFLDVTVLVDQFIRREQENVELINTPVQQNFFLARQSAVSGYIGNTKDPNQTNWIMHWVATLDDGRTESQFLDKGSQWSWITTSFFHGSATNGIVFSSEFTFNSKGSLTSHSATWTLVGPVASRTNQDRINYTMNHHVMTLGETDFARLATGALATVRHNRSLEMARAMYREKFPKDV